MKKLYPDFLFFLAVVIVFIAPSGQGAFAQTALKPVISNYTTFTKKPLSAPKTSGKSSTFSVSDNLNATETFNNNATEVIEKRTLNSKYFVDKDTASKFYKLVSYGGNLNYLKNGKLETIDDRLEPAGNGLLEAANQQEPVGFDINHKTAFIATTAGKVNFNNWVLYGEKGGTKTVVAKASWLHYTVGDDGLMVYNIFPGIDAEMQVQRGAIKTNLTIRKNEFPDVEKFVFEDQFKAAQNLGALAYDQSTGEHQKATFGFGNKTCLNIGRAIVFTEKNPAADYSYLDYTITGTRLSFSLDASFINQKLASGNIIIDPLVAATATLAQNDITGSMNCGSSSNYCSYKFVVPTPAKATFTSVSFMFEFYAYAPSGQNQGHFSIKTGNCSTGSFTVVNPTINTGPGSVSSSGVFIPLPGLLTCMPAPSCTSQNVPFEFAFFNDYCAAGTGCSSTYVKANQPLVIKIEGYTLELASITSPVTICSGTPAVLGIVAQYGVPPYTYKWSNGATTSTINVAPASNTNYSVVATDQCGNTITGSTAVTVNPIPLIAAVTSNTPLCTGARLNLSVPVVAGATYSWTGPNNFSSTISNPSLTNVTAAQSGVYTVTETVNGCTSAPVTVNVEISAPVTPAITIAASATTLCAGTNITFTATPVNGGNIPVYQWQVNGKNSGTNSSTYSNNALADNDLVTCILTSNAGCATSPTATSNTVTVKVNPVLIPAISITANTATTICANTAVTFTATAVNGGNAPSYLWLLNGNKTGADAATYTNTGLNNLDEVSCILTSNALCTTSTTVSSNVIKFNITPLVTPDVSVTASATAVCPGTKITFNATPVNGGNVPAYQWKLNNADIAGANSSTYENASFNNNDVITCTIKSDIACVTTAFATSKNITITVNVPVTPGVSVAASATTICAGAEVMFTATPASGGTTPNYQWKLNGINTGTNSATYSNSILKNGDMVNCILTGNAPCSTINTATSNTIAMVVNPVLVPSVGITASATAICAGTPVTFTASAVNCGKLPQYNWQLNGSNTGVNTLNYTNSNLLNGDVVTCLIIPDPAGCYTVSSVGSNKISAVVNLLPIVTAGRDTVVFKGSSFRLNGNSGGIIAQYTWSPAVYLSSTTVQNPVITPLATTRYTLRAISSSGCEAVAQVTVKVLTKIVIPNTFTPNGDGINDVWAIAGLEDYPGATIDVYSRYGQQVLHTTTYKQWDGTFNGKPLPLSTYYYIINPKNNMPLLSGWVAIVK